MYRREAATGALVETGSCALPAPSWVQWHPSLPLVYAASEIDHGAVGVIDVAPNGTPRLIDQWSTGGANPCHLALSPDARVLFAANYSSGSVAAFALSKDGSITQRVAVSRHRGSGPNPQRQEAPHPHMAVPARSTVAVVDLGTDEIRAYRSDELSSDTPHVTSTLPAGCGPRQLVRDPARPGVAYAVAELSGQLLGLDEPEPGTFLVRAAVPASQRGGENLPAQLTLSGDGLFAYLSNRGPDTIAVFDITTVTPTRVGEYALDAACPRHFAIADSALYAAAQLGDAIIAFDIDPVTGALTEGRRYHAATPTCIALQPRDHRTRGAIHA